MKQHSGAACGAIFVFTVAVTVLVKASGHPDFWSVAVPGVLTGCGTLALAGVTYLVLRGDQLDRRKRDAQDAQDARAADQQRRAQARLVHVSEARSAKGPSDGFGRLDPMTAIYRGEVVNRSDDTIGECSVFISVRPREALARVTQPDEISLGRILPGALREFETTAQITSTQADGSPVGIEVAVWCVYRDAAGVLWCRDPFHHLLEIETDGIAYLRASARNGSAQLPASALR